MYVAFLHFFIRNTALLFNMDKSKKRLDKAKTKIMCICCPQAV